MNGLARLLDGIVERIEHASVLDPLADTLAAVDRRLIRGPLRDLLSGTPLGHPVHPLLIALPIGTWTSALVFDLLGEDDVATTLTGLGLLAAGPTVVTGASDWAYTAGAERRVGTAHLIGNSLAITAYACSWFARRAGRRRAGVALSLVGAVFLVKAGWLGGHLAYALGVGVDTTAFQQIPEGWHDVAEESEVRAGAWTPVEVDGVSVALTRHGNRVVALVDRCTHRGGPLHEGPLLDGCAECPWHHSRFSLDDGSVVRGPATRPQFLLDVRVSEGRVAVSRPAHERTLRTNPVGH